MRRFTASQIPILSLGLVLILIEPGPEFYSIFKNGIVLLFLGIILVSRYRLYRYCQDQIAAEKQSGDSD
jgi:hypothetical protein